MPSVCPKWHSGKGRELSARGNCVLQLLLAEVQQLLCHRNCWSTSGSELLRLEKIFKIMSNHQPITTEFTTKPSPQVSHPHILGTLPGMVTLSLLWAACSSALPPFLCSCSLYRMTQGIPQVTFPAVSPCRCSPGSHGFHGSS